MLLGQSLMVSFKVNMLLHSFFIKTYYYNELIIIIIIIFIIYIIKNN